ncbi:MAG: hypothetical protein P8Y69_03700 [Gammaproteobacteria bacterium]
MLITGVLIGAVALSWTGILEQTADSRLSATLQRALVTAAVARGLNAVISVAQGTELAVQPIGVGITITAGEILDPLNDLVERFSWLALVASASLGTQLLLTQIVTEPIISQVLSAVALICLVFVWWPRRLPGRRGVLRLVLVVLFARFLFTVVGLTAGLMDAWVLETRQEAALSELTSARDDIEALQDEPIPPLEPDESSIRRTLESLIDEGRQLLDLEARLDALQARVEAAIDQLLDLTVVFLVQTILVPIGTFWLSLAAFRSLWAWARD